MSMTPSGFFSGHRSNFMYDNDPQFVANNPFGPSFSDPFFQNTWSPFHGHSQYFGAPTHMMNPSFFPHTMSSTFSRFEWKETPEGHVLTADLPGMTKEDVKVEAVEDGRVLAISGEKKMDKENKTDGWYHVEHASGNFLRRFRLPEGAVADGLSTQFENGVITVTVSKKNDQNISISGP